VVPSEKGVLALRQIRVAGAFLVVAICIGSASAQIDNSIVPGERISGIHLGSSINEGISTAIQAFGGAPTRATQCTNEEDRKAGYQCISRIWDGPDDLLTFLAFIGPPGQERTIAVATSRKEHKTVDGLGWSSSLADFTRVFGEPQRGPKVPVGYGHDFHFTSNSAEFFNWAWWPALGLAVVYAKNHQDVRVTAIFSRNR